VAGVALGDTDVAFVWQALRLLTSTFLLRGKRGTSLMALGWIWWRAWAPLVARGAAALCVAGVALGDTDFRFPWQEWRLLTFTFVLRGGRGAYDTGLDLVARLGTVNRPWRRGTLRGSRGTWRHPHFMCLSDLCKLCLSMRYLPATRSVPAMFKQVVHVLQKTLCKPFWHVLQQLHASHV